jgi:hypothetical protein
MAVPEDVPEPDVANVEEPATLTLVDEGSGVDVVITDDVVPEENVLSVAEGEAEDPVLGGDEVGLVLVGIGDSEFDGSEGFDSLDEVAVVGTGVFVPDSEVGAADSTGADVETLDSSPLDVGLTYVVAGGSGE